MELSSALVYSLRYAPKLALPIVVQDAISKLRIVPAVYRPVKHFKPKFHKKKDDLPLNWRERVLVEYVSKIRDGSDKEYQDIMDILNKVVSANVKEMGTSVIDIMKKRDDQFRLRISTLLFDKAIRQSFYSAVMADMAKEISIMIPEISDDFEAHVGMFNTLYDMNSSVKFPVSGEENYEQKVEEWMKQKDRRKGYAKFLTHLYVRQLVSGKPLHESVTHILNEVSSLVVRERNEQTVDNVDQYVDFLLETAKLLPKTAVELRGLLLTTCSDLLKKPRTEVPCLGMKSRFRIEDIVKCVQAS